MKKLVLMAAAIVAVSFEQLTLNKQQLILSVSLTLSQLLKQPQLRQQLRQLIL